MIEADKSALEKSICIFKIINKGLPIPIDIIKEYYNTPGIIFLKKHLKKYGGIDFSENLFFKLYENLISKKSNIPENIFIRSMKMGLDYVEINEIEIAKINIEEIITRAVENAYKFLPNRICGTIKIYFLYGIRGTGITLDNEIAIDFCDNYLNKNGIIDSDKLIFLLAHELHHVAVNGYLLKNKQEYTGKKRQLLIDFFGELMSEGVAYYYLPSPYDEEGIYGSNWNRNLNNIGNIFNKINYYIERIMNGTSLDLTEAGLLFNEGLEGYTAGYVMAETIDKTFGKDIVISCLEDCFKFMYTYNESLVSTNSELPKILL